MAETNMNRIPLVLNRDGHPFVFHNTDLHRIEFVHGSTVSIIRLVKGTPVSVASREAGNGSRGTLMHDSRGHVYCSVEENGPGDDIIISIKHRGCYTQISFPYSPWQPAEERRK